MENWWKTRILPPLDEMQDQYIKLLQKQTVYNSFNEKKSNKEIKGSKLKKPKKLIAYTCNDKMLQ